jgi:hypothetical protein
MAWGRDTRTWAPAPRPARSGHFDAAWRIPSSLPQKITRDGGFAAPTVRAFDGLGVAGPGSHPRTILHAASGLTPYLSQGSRAIRPRRPSLRRSWSIRSRRQDAASSSLRTVKPSIPLRAARTNPVGENSANCIGPGLLR